MPLSFVRHFPTVFATTAKESYIRKEQSGKGGKGGKKERKEGKGKQKRGKKEEQGKKRKRGKRGKEQNGKDEKSEKKKNGKKQGEQEKTEEGKEETKKAVNSSEHAPAAGRYKKISPVKGRMKENGLLQRRNVKLRNFAATCLPRGGIKKSLPSRGGMKENDLLQRRNVKLRNFARFDFNTGIAHVSGFDHKPLAPGQLGGQIVKIAAV